MKQQHPQPLPDAPSRQTPHQGARHRPGEKTDLHHEQEAPDDERRDTGSHANDIKRVDPTDNEADRTTQHDNDSDQDARERRRGVAHESH
jgi:hypothetical protein